MEFSRAIEAGHGRRTYGEAVNGAWLGQVFHAIGMRNDTIDIAVGYPTRLADFNRSVDSFDMVLNGGVKEHILNQYNAFKCDHRVARVEGRIVHQVLGGHRVHRCYCYTSRLFFDLAGFRWRLGLSKAGPYPYLRSEDETQAV